MKASKEVLKVVLVHFYKEDNNEDSELITKIFPCANETTAKEFESFYRNKLLDTQLYKIDIIDSNIYG